MQKKILISAASAILLVGSLAGCSTETPAPQQSKSAAATTAPTQTATPTPTATTPSKAQAQQGSADLVASFYNSTFTVDPATVTAAEKINTNHDSYSASEYSKKMEALLPSLKNISHTTSTPARLAAFEYGYTLSALAASKSLAAAGNANAFKFFVTADKVEISENNTVGEVPADAVGVEYNGDKQTNTSSTGSIHTIYENGKWYIDASKD